MALATLRPGLYLLADESVIDFPTLATLLPQILATGVVLVQYRAKSVDPARRLRHAIALSELCRNARVPLLINDDIELAVDCNASGAHLGGEDTDLAVARERLGKGAILGASCYNDMTRARNAVAAGADYVSFGRLFASSTKPDAPPAQLDILGRARRELGVPVCGIGGIRAETALAVRQAGADLLACAHGVLGQADPVAAARRLVTIINEN